MARTRKLGDTIDIVAVAKEAGVSISTVSRSYNHPDLVKAATRRRIEKAIEKLGYIRNRAAQTIHGIRSGTIGLVVPTIDHAIFAEVVQAFSDSVDEAGFTILLASHGYDLGREYAVLRKFLEHRVDGIALIGLDHPGEVFRLIEQQDIPAILIWNYEPVTPLPCVGADNFMAGRMIAEHILELGHRDIALVLPPLEGNDRAGGRAFGISETLKDAGVDVPDAWRLETPYSISAAKRDVHHVLGQSHRPSAIICGNDVLAWGALYGAKAHGLSVPDGISIAGIGDFKGSKELEPALTTVRLPAQQIGRNAGQAIAMAITQPGTVIENQHCAPELVVRATCAALKC